jgi:hypothetical protein
MEFSEKEVVQITGPTDTTPITSIPGRIVTTSFDIDSISPIQNIVLSLENSVFDDKTKIIEKRNSKKRKMTHHGETTQLSQLWIFLHLNDEEFAEKCVDSLAEFSSANK